MKDHGGKLHSYQYETENELDSLLKNYAMFTIKSIITEGLEQSRHLFKATSKLIHFPLPIIKTKHSCKNKQYFYY